MSVPEIKNHESPGSKKLSRIVAYLSPILFYAIYKIVTVLSLSLFHNGTRPNVVEQLVPVSIAMLLTTIIGLTISGQIKNFKIIIGLKKPSTKYLLIGGILGLGLFIILEIVGVMTHVAGADTGSNEISQQMYQLSGLTKIIGLFIIMAFLAPIVEEIFFRGFILNLLRIGHSVDSTSWNPGTKFTSILFVSTFFALAHFQGGSDFSGTMSLIWPFTFSVLSCILRIESDSIVPSFIMHIFYNLLTAVVISLA